MLLDDDGKYHIPLGVRILTMGIIDKVLHDHPNIYKITSKNHLAIFNIDKSHHHINLHKVVCLEVE